MIATSEWKILESGSFPYHTDCTWNIRSEYTTGGVQLQIIKYKIVFHNDYIKIFDRSVIFRTVVSEVVVTLLHYFCSPVLLLLL